MKKAKMQQHFCLERKKYVYRKFKGVFGRF